MERDRSWRATAVLFLLALGILVLLIGLGVFDPKPLGNMGWQEPLTRLSVGAESREVMWLTEVEEGMFTVRGTAVFQSGERDIAYGFVLGNDDDYLAVAVSPLGYVRVWQSETVLMPWQPWPHVHQGHEPNEFWLDVHGNSVTIRLNREILWVGEVTVAGGIGVVGESWGGTAVVQVSSIQLFWPQ